MSKAIAATSLLALLTVVSDVAADNIKVKLVNKSNFEIHEMYLSATKQKDWGQDQLGEEVIAKDGSFELRNIPVGKYDLKLVDEDSDECIVSGIKVAANEEVEITDELLVGCQAGTTAAEEEAE